MNREAEKKQRKEIPVVTANFLSKLTFWWLKELFQIGYKRPIEEDEIYEVKDGLRSDKNTEALYALWEEELERKNPSIIRAMFRLNGIKLLLWGIVYSLTETATRVVQPLCLGGLVAFFAPNQTQISITDAYWYAFGISFSTAIMVLTFHPFILYVFTMSAKYRIGCSGLIYKKSLKLSKSSTEDGLNSKVINLISNDLAKFDMGLGFLHDVWKGPIEAIVFGIVIYFEIGISAIIGMAFLASFIPLQAWIGKKSAQLRLRTAKRTDFRVKVMNEIILGIQVIKMYAWEKSFATMVDQIRKKEVNAIRGIAYVRATITSFAVISKLSIFLSLASYVYFDNVVTARKVFIVSSYFNILNWSMVYFWPVSLTNVAEAYISTKRVQEFLLKSETKPKIVHSSDDKLNIIDNLKSDTSLAIISNGKSDEKKKLDDYRRKNVVADSKKGLKMKRMDDESKQLILARRIVDLDAPLKGVIMENATAVWTLTDDQKNHGISNIDLDIQPGLLCAVVGPVGSGKSTLLNVILGELELDDGSITINGTISYAGQEPWLFEGSVRSNILFVEEYDERRYNEVIKVCALERDFRLLANGDQTIVGERGVSLSGGQRARVNLARAIYKDADIYLLDDPLSAVDTHVGKHIFNKCVRDFLKNKCCVLVTHQLQYLQNIQHVVLMHGGRIEAQGPYRTLRRKSKETLLGIQAVDENETTAETFETRIKKSRSSTASFCEEEYEASPADRKEHQATGAVSFKIYKIFFKAVDSAFYVGTVFIMFIIAQIASSGADYFVSQWVNWEEKVATTTLPVPFRNQTNNETSAITEKTLIDSTTTISTIAVAATATTTTTTTTIANEFNSSTIANDILNTAKSILLNTTDNTNANDDEQIVQKRQQFMLTYAIIMAVCVTVYLYRSFSFFRLCLRVSINLHDKLFRGITRAKMIFFNNNPSGRILNRFARDINNVDSLLPMVLIDVIDFFLNLIAIMCLVGVINYWLLIPTGIMTILFYIIQSVYVHTARSLKRIEALSRSPVYSHINATLQGLSTVRSFGAQKILESEFHSYQNHNTSSWFLFISSTRGFALWLDIVCLIYITFVTYSFLLIINESQSGNVGLAILNSINLVGMCQWGMRQTAELENQMTSVERIVEYADLPPEPPLESDEKDAPPKDWPRAGNLAFKSLSLRYIEHGGRTLRDLTFNIEAKEKVGIVGRTGAGKSSIIQALFRLANNYGQILIDGIDIGSIGLHELRKKVSIIPQDPVLFSGKLRFNLDPFGEKKDIELWDALEQVELKSVVSSMAGGLDCKMLDGGSNFSMGQRQLVCLARAILRNNNILILDEATANVDPDTDKLIQDTIRTKFADCTVLTIAHRLHTVMDNDKVLVMDAGEVVEFDHPYILIQKSDGFFKRLVDQTGSATSTALILAAKENYEKQKKDN